MANATLISVSSLRLISEASRRIFFWIILTITVVTLIGNVFAIRSIIKRKQKCLQKVCIISLALADIFSVVMFAMNYLDTLSKELKTWSLGEFLCYFIPMGQVLGTTASSFALLAIAIDRYQTATVTIISKRWNPTIWQCLIVALASWAVCTITAYPMFMFFTYNPVRIVYIEGVEPVFEDAYVCVAIDKSNLMLYYILMALLIFLPIIVIFIWFYYKIAAMIWRHRKPFIARFNKRKSTADKAADGSCNEETPCPHQNPQPKPIMKKSKNVQVERKIRTFKVVIVLMLAFTICRLPYWVYFVIKLVKTITGTTMWDISFALTSLNILNCALNPFLYTFLNQTIRFRKNINSLCCKLGLCCCCFTNADFEDFEKNELFGGINYDQTPANAENHRNNVNNSRVKFIDVAHLQMYSGRALAGNEM